MPTIIQPKLPRVVFFEGKPGNPYRPCNGTEGEFFHAMWCEHCEHDKVMNGSVHQNDANPERDLCMVLNASFCSDEPLPEWNYGDDGQPRCTKFIPVGEKTVERCSNTLDMFSDSAS